VVGLRFWSKEAAKQVDNFPDVSRSKSVFNLDTLQWDLPKIYIPDHPLKDTKDRTPAVSFFYCLPIGNSLNY
jgi:hypothetical protein